MTVSEELAGLKERLQEELAELQAAAVSLIDCADQEMDAIFARHGYRRCMVCHGTGAIGRLDAGYMRRFGFKEWDGCKICGGSQDQRGLGCIPITRENDSVHEK